MNLVVTNGDPCENGWDITIDSGPIRVRRAGQTAPLRDLTPGIRIEGWDPRPAGVASPGRRPGHATLALPQGRNR